MSRAKNLGTVMYIFSISVIDFSKEKNQLPKNYQQKQGVLYFLIYEQIGMIRIQSM